MSSHVADILCEMSIVPPQGICDKLCNLYSRVESTLTGQPNVNVQHSLRYQALRSNMEKTLCFILSQQRDNCIFLYHSCPSREKPIEGKMACFLPDKNGNFASFY
jgi:hypothetical protein